MKLFPRIFNVFALRLILIRRGGNSIARMHWGLAFLEIGPIMCVIMECINVGICNIKGHVNLVGRVVVKGCLCQKASVIKGCHIVNSCKHMSYHRIDTRKKCIVFEK